MPRTPRDLRSKRFRLASASTGCAGAILAILAGDVQPVPHVSAPPENVSSVFFCSREVASISFGNDAGYAPIQAADLLGNCFLKALRNRARDPNANLSFNLLTRRLLLPAERGYAEFVFAADALRDVVEHRRADPRFLPEFA